jgi:UDPglucose--hexose-1-phosphate uridylyltransferase
VAPGRARRPGAQARTDPGLPTEDELLSCPFCEGREDRTPPETFALRPKGGETDSPGWTVRVVPNLYPAFDVHEVVVSTPRHVRSFAELTSEEIDGVATAWRERARALGGRGYLHALLNEGREAGASLTHTHTQLALMPHVPPAVALEDDARDCAVCAHVAAERGAGVRLVTERDGLILLAAYGGRLPYELLIAPATHPARSAYGDDRLGAALRLLADSLRRLHAIEGVVPANAWLHDRGHWHIEVVPRLTVFAGIELGGGIYVNALAPEDAAAALRDAG